MDNDMDTFDDWKRWNAVSEIEEQALIQYLLYSVGWLRNKLVEENIIEDEFIR